MPLHVLTNLQKRRSLTNIGIENGLCEKYTWHLMRLIAHSFPILKAHSGLQVKGQHTGAQLAGHWKEGLNRVDLTDGCVFGNTTDQASSNHSMTPELLTTREASSMEWLTLRNHIPCLAHVVELSLGAFMSSLGVKGCIKSWEALQCDQQFGENENTDIGKSQRLRKEGNARINKV